MHKKYGQIIHEKLNNFACALCFLIWVNIGNGFLSFMLSLCLRPKFCAIILKMFYSLMAINSVNCICLAHEC